MTALIGFTGDLMCHAGFVVQEEEGTPFDRYFSPELTALCQSHDELWGNLEGPVSARGNGMAVWERMRTLRRTQWPKLFFLEHYLPLLRQLRFTVLSVANNHSFDFETPDDTAVTVEVLSRHGFAAPGRDFTPVVRQVNDVTFAIFATTCLLNPPHIEGPVAHLDERNVEALCAQIVRWRREVDYVTVMTHWGWDYVEQPTEKVRGLAAKLMEAGAKIIYGNHPHVLWPIEQVAPDRLVVYCLGNFTQVFGVSPAHPKYRLFRRALHSGVLSLAITPQKIEIGFQPTFVWQNFEAWVADVPGRRSFWFWNDADVARWWPARRQARNRLRSTIAPFGTRRDGDLTEREIATVLGR